MNDSEKKTADGNLKVFADLIVTFTNIELGAELPDVQGCFPFCC